MAQRRPAAKKPATKKQRATEYYCVACGFAHERSKEHYCNPCGFTHEQSSWRNWHLTEMFTLCHGVGSALCNFATGPYLDTTTSEVLAGKAGHGERARTPAPKRS